MRIRLNDLSFEVANDVRARLVRVAGDSLRLQGAQRRIDNLKVNRLRYAPFFQGIGWARMDRETGRGVRGLLDSTAETRFRAVELGILHESQTHASPLDHIQKYQRFGGTFYGTFESDFSSTNMSTGYLAAFDPSSDTWPAVYMPTFNAASYDNSCDGWPCDTASSFTVAHTVQSVESGRIVLAWVAVSGTTAGDPTGVTYAGAAMTKLDTVTKTSSGPTTYTNLSCWHKINPATGSNDCVATWGSAQTRVSLGVEDYYDVNTGSPFLSAGEEQGTGTSTSVDVATTRGALVVMSSHHAHLPSADDIAPGSGQTETFNADAGGAVGFGHAGSYERATGTSVTMSASWGISSDFVSLVVPLQSGNGLVNLGNTTAEGVRIFDMAEHKGNLIVLGSKGSVTADEAEFEWFKTSNGTSFTVGAGTNWPTTSYLTTTITRRNNFDDDEAKLEDFGNTLMVALHDNRAAGTGQSIRLF